MIAPQDVITVKGEALLKCVSNVHQVQEDVMYQRVHALHVEVQVRIHVSNFSSQTSFSTQEV